MSLIYVVDDSPTALAAMAAYLHMYTVTCYPDAVELYSAMAQVTPDAIVLDAQLPGDDGWDVLQSGRISPDIPVVIVSARASNLRPLELANDKHMWNRRLATLDKGHLADLSDVVGRILSAATDS